jgi:hypothetical protein
MINNVLHMINLKLSSKRHLRRNRQSASQSTVASQTSKCVAIDKCVANVKVRRNRHLLARKGTRLASKPSHHRVDGAAMTRTGPRESASIMLVMARQHNLCC